METMGKIKTRVHPLNEELCAKLKNNKEIIFSEAERPNNVIKFLDMNSMLLPLLPENPNYKAGCQYERLSDMFVEVFQDYDIITMQEVLAIFTGELKEIVIEFALKAGFIYHYEQKPSCPLPIEPYFCDSGLMILSRFPIVESDFQQFSLGLFDDAEVQRGILYAKIQITAGKTIQVFTLHTQCTNYSYESQYVKVARMIRDSAMDELVAFMETKITGDSLTLLAGDFNILRYPLGKTFLGQLFGRNPSFVDYLSLVDEEYDHLIETLKNGDHFSIVNCWERDNGGPNTEK